MEDFKCQCEALFRSAQETAQFVYQYAAEHPEQLSIAVDLIPGVADVRAGVELVTGHDYITGEDVPRWEAREFYPWSLLRFWKIIEMQIQLRSATENATAGKKN